MEIIYIEQISYVLGARFSKFDMQLLKYYMQAKYISF